MYAPRKGSGEKVQLFLGCVADISQPQVTASAIAVLNAIGVEVEIPKSQGCCGALDQHAGRSTKAAELARNNMKAFSGDAPILGSASGCTASLLEYDQIAGAGAEAQAFALRAQDIAAWLARHPLIPRIEFKEWEALALVQAPCTQRNVLKTEKAGFELLKLIPGLKVKAIPASMGCCGAAGSYMLTEPEQADGFADAYAAYIQEHKAELLGISRDQLRYRLKKLSDAESHDGEEEGQERWRGRYQFELRQFYAEGEGGQLYDAR